MKRLITLTIVAGILTFATPALARGWHRGASFWGGFAVGALSGAVLGPPVVVTAPPAVVALPPPGWAPRRVWWSGAYPPRRPRCGTRHRAWRPGYYPPY